MGELTREHKYPISVMKINGYRQINITRTIGKDKSVISQELNKNKHRGKYKDDLAIINI